MPSHDAKRASAETSADSDRQGSRGPLGRRLSRRSVLQGAATAGAAGLVATAMGAAAASPAAAATRTRAGRPRSGGEVPARSEPIVVHVRNARSGDIEVFSGTSQNRLRDKDLAARIVRAIG
jgi:hypothetical protein